ncbi:MAG: PD-(D/E)XK nuclease family protein [Aquabacterium sp.]
MPSRRAQRWPAAAANTGPGGRERLLLAWALEWAAHTAVQGLPTDVLYGLRPSALVVTTAGAAISPGTELHLTQGVMQHLREQGVPALWLSAMPLAATPPESRLQAPCVIGCTDAEDEAQQAAAQVIAAVNAARQQPAQDRQQPVALIALDRSLIRRVRAMLEEAGARIADETGWRLSTTRAAAVLSRLLQASHPRATTDELLDWLKSGWISGPADEGNPERQLANASGQLEIWCRRHGMLSAWSLQVPALDALSADDVQTVAENLPQVVPEGGDAMPASAVRLWHWAREVLGPLQALWSARRPRMQEWVLALRDCLAASGSLSALAADPAGQLALETLRFGLATQACDLEQAWQGLSSQVTMDGRAFQRWVGSVLEDTTFRPEAPEDEADVVITPMARAVLRPFHAIVLPGADERQLGALASPSGWLGTKLLEAMTLPTPQTQRAAQWDAFQLLMNRPGVICLHRHAQGSEPLEPSPWLEKWAAHEGVALARGTDRLVHLSVPHTPVRTPLPSLDTHHEALPMQVTATSYEALRQCPYRFFATSVLGLREQDELDEGLDRSDFGIWLHEVLLRFHLARQQQLALSNEQEDVQAWLAVAAKVIREQGLDRDGQRPYFLPFSADLDRLAQGYVRWLREHEDKGWSVQHVEHKDTLALTLAPDLSVRLHGQLDRVDIRHEAGERRRFVLDYKTGNRDALKAKVAQPLEDTQLAFYAALSGRDAPVDAAYLHLDARSVTQIDHAEVAHSAEALLQGVASDWARLRAGAPLKAMGEGAACAFCQARGLCRKDHWSPHAPEAMEDSEQRQEASPS